MTYNWFHEKGSWSIHSFNLDYLSIPKCPGSWGNHFHEIPVKRSKGPLFSEGGGGTKKMFAVCFKYPNLSIFLMLLFLFSCFLLYFNTQTQTLPFGSEFPPVQEMLSKIQSYPSPLGYGIFLSNMSVHQSVSHLQSFSEPSPGSGLV